MSKCPVPERAFQELHLDFGEYAGHKFLAVVDGYSGFPMIYHCGKRAPASELINGLRSIFIQTCVPERVWSDGGPQFTSNGFKAFLQRWGVDHETSSPEFPQGNGRAEAGIKNLKKMIRGSYRQGRLDHNLFLEALLLYRNTPMHDGRVPSVLVYGKPLRDTLPPHRRNFSAEWQKSVQEMEVKAAEKQEEVQAYFDSHAKPLKVLKVGDPVAVYDNTNKAWNRYGKVVELMRNRNYLVKMSSGRVLRRNRRLIRLRESRSLPGAQVQVGVQAQADPRPRQAEPLRQDAPPPPVRSLRPRGSLKRPERLIETMK